MEPAPLSGLREEIVLTSCVVGAVLIFLITRKSGLFAADEPLAGSRAAFRWSLAEWQKRRQPIRVTRKVREGAPGDKTCPICFENAQYALETNCGHLYCASCIKAFWDHARVLQRAAGTGSGSGTQRAMDCPCCRQPVRMFFDCFTSDESSTEPRISTADPAAIEQKTEFLRDYNAMFSGVPRPLWQQLKDGPNAIRVVARDLLSGGVLAVLMKIRLFMLVVVMATYLLSPLDLIPDSLLGFVGIIDDLIIVAFALLYLTTLYRSAAIARWH